MMRSYKICGELLLLVFWLPFLSSPASGQPSEVSAKRYVVRSTFSDECYESDEEHAELNERLGKVLDSCMERVYTKHLDDIILYETRGYEVPVRMSLYLEGKPALTYRRLSCDVLDGFVAKVHQCDGKSPSFCEHATKVSAKNGCRFVDNMCERGLRSFMGRLSQEKCGLVLHISTERMRQK